MAADKISAGSGKKSESWTRMRRKWWQWRTAGRHLKVGRSWNCWFPRISLWSVWISWCTEHDGSLFFFLAIERWGCFQDKCIHFWLNLRPYTGFWFNHNWFRTIHQRRWKKPVPCMEGAKPPHSTSSVWFCHHVIGVHFLFSGPNTLPQEESVKKMLCTVLQGEKSKGRTMMWSDRE